VLDFHRRVRRRGRGIITAAHSTSIIGMNKDIF
jgi:hypothetical protein